MVVFIFFVLGSLCYKLFYVDRQAIYLKSEPVPLIKVADNKAHPVKKYLNRPYCHNYGLVKNLDQIPAKKIGVVLMFNP